MDTATRWAFCELAVGHISSRVTAAFVHLARSFSELGVALGAVLTDNGPEYVGGTFKGACAELDITHHRIPARSPNRQRRGERFQGTALQECYRPAFHRRRFDRVADLDQCLQDFVHRYNTRRRNHGDFMNGRTPLQLLEAAS